MKKDSELNRRAFLEFLGKTAIMAQPMASMAFASIQNRKPNEKILSLTPLRPVLNDELLFSPEISFYPLIERLTKISPNLEYGDNNDFLTFLPSNNKNDEGLLWINHEYPEIEKLFDEFGTRVMNKKMVDACKKRVGGTIVKIKKNSEGKFVIVEGDPANFRIDANTSIPIISENLILGTKNATGTFANCSGGLTPWGTILTCEENYDDFVGEVSYDEQGNRHYDDNSKYQWTKFDSYTPEHYGWVVEINPMTKKAKKLTALGRFAHEGALNVQANDQRTVVYMGDDTENQFLYKFISEQKGSLETGELFVADTVKGKWLSLDRNKSEILKKNFKNQTELLIQTRKAAQLLGATPQDRPEGIAVHPKTGEIFISLTNNTDKNNYYGKILKLTEEKGDHLSLNFTTSDFLVGGKRFAFACPDNLVFDLHGNLWVTTDTSGTYQGKPPYDLSLGGNALYMVPTTGANAGKPQRVGSAPAGGEFTGPTFLKDGKTLLLSLQHPGEHLKQKSKWNSQVLVIDLSKII